MEGCKSANLTPTENNKFQFPPNISTSAGRLRDISNLCYSGNKIRRSFTPIRRSFFVTTPDISPIEPFYSMDFKRIPDTKVKKAAADSTVLGADESLTCEEDFILMPPPAKRKPAGSGAVIASLNSLAMQKLDERITLRSSPRKFLRLPTTLQNIAPTVDILNGHVSLESLLRDTGLKHHIETFQVQKIDLELCLTMDDDDLKRIGIADENERQLILFFKEMF